MAPLRDGVLAAELIAIGYVMPLALCAFGWALPATARVSAGLAGVLMVVGQVQAKAAIVLLAGRLRPITGLRRQQP